MDVACSSKSERKRFEAVMVGIAVKSLGIKLSSGRWPAFLDEHFEYAETLSEAKRVQPDGWGMMDGLPVVIEAVNSHGVSRRKMRIYAELDNCDEIAIAIINKHGVVACDNPFILYHRMVDMGTY